VIKDKIFDPRLLARAEKQILLTLKTKIMDKNELTRFAVQELSESELIQTVGGGWFGKLVLGFMEWFSELRILFI
jgi:hypothetical protein